MENDRHRLVVIMAGYEAPMKTMIASNPGLKSRFQNVIRFEDYTADEMEAIFLSMADDQDYQLTGEARQRMRGLMQRLWEERGEDFANARDVRNLFEACVAHQANRIVNRHINDPRLLSRIEGEDVPINPRDTHTDPGSFGLS
jgi:stage V sporulation protein K